MSGTDKFNKDELIKSLADSVGISVEEAAAMINEDAFKDDGLEKSQKSDKEDDYSEETEKEMEKAMNEAKEAYETYKSKKPKQEIQKSEEDNLGKQQDNSELLKSMETMFGGLKESFGEKFESFEKSLSQVEDLKEELSLLKSQIEEIGNHTPPAKSFGITNEAIIEKAMGGVQEDGVMHYSAKINKEQVGNLLGELVEETNGDLQKSLEIDLSNYVSGAGILGETAKRILKEKKNVIVH